MVMVKMMRDGGSPGFGKERTSSVLLGAALELGQEKPLLGLLHILKSLLVVRDGCGFFVEVAEPDIGHALGVANVSPALDLAVAGLERTDQEQGILPEEGLGAALLLYPFRQALPQPARRRLNNLLLHVGRTLPEVQLAPQRRKARQAPRRLSRLLLLRLPCPGGRKADGGHVPHVLYFEGNLCSLCGFQRGFVGIFGVALVEDGLALLDGEVLEDWGLQLLQLQLQLLMLPKLLGHCLWVHYLVFLSHCVHYIYMSAFILSHSVHYIYFLQLASQIAASAIPLNYPSTFPKGLSLPSNSQFLNTSFKSVIAMKRSIAAISMTYYKLQIAMKAIDPNETVLEQGSEQVQGTTIINVVPHKDEAFAIPPKKSKRKTATRQQRLPKIINDYNEQPESEVPEDERKQLERGSEGKMRGADQQTAGELEQNGLAPPYEFLTERAPSVRKIFFPRMSAKSATFVLTVLYSLAFLVLIGYNYSKQQTPITWNCSLYLLQNKYYPRLVANYELWRIIVSAFFHSNFAHFFLDLFALQIYGYFVEWYYGLKPFLITVGTAALYGHVMAAAVQKTSVSTTSSAVFMAVAALKIYFLWEYRNYKKLYDRRTFLYILLVLIVGINFIPIFVVNNVDFSAHLGGFIAGALLGMFFLKSKLEAPTSCQLALKWGALLLLVASFIVLLALIFSDTSLDNLYLSQQIQEECRKNSA